MGDSSGTPAASAFELRRLQIVKTAASLFIKQGYLKTGMRQIAKSSGITVGTLYHYVHSKDHILSLFNEVSVDIFMKFRQQKKFVDKHTTSAEALTGAIRDYFTLVDETQDVNVFWYQETKNLNHSQREALIRSDEQIATVFYEILKRGRESGEFKIKDPLLFAHNLIVLGDMWAFRRWFLRKHYNFNQYLEEQISAILYGLLDKPR